MSGPDRPQQKPASEASAARPLASSVTATGVDGVIRFYSLDALRGIAALSVVMYHWIHFFYVGTAPHYDISRAPFFGILYLAYTQGWLAVDIFFALSGFIFYRLYSRAVAAGTISASSFALLRFSRLYPLHLTTLLVVALGQLWAMQMTGSYFVYSWNDARHFLLNLFFASAWGMERGLSFNGPAWSVSVEISLYALFFAGCRLLPLRPVILAACSVFGFLVVATLYMPIGRGMGAFFMGGCVLMAYEAIVASRHARLAARATTVLALIAWALTLVASQPSLDLSPLIDRSPFLMSMMLRFWPVVALFPLTILALALNEALRGSLGKRLAFLGDISYSSYLLHFPLQLVIAMVWVWLGLDRALFYSPWLLAAFFGVLISLSLASYHYLERPAQRLLRQRRASIGAAEREI